MRTKKLTTRVMRTVVSSVNGLSSDWVNPVAFFVDFFGRAVYYFEVNFI